MLKTANVNSRSRRGFAVAGWLALHQAVLDRGAEVDYYPPDYPELGAQRYVDASQYQALVGRVLKLANIDIHHYGCLSDVISDVVWRWISTTARREIPEHYRLIAETQSWTALLAAFKDWTKNESVTIDGSRYRASDLPSVARFGYWLYSEGELSSYPSITAILWGLAFIGAAWDTQLRCGICQICFRQSRPRESHCDFHSQSAAIDLPRSELFQRYRRGLLVRDLALQDTVISQLLLDSPITRCVEKRLALPNVLFPFNFGSNGSDAHKMLIDTLEVSPRVVETADIAEFRTIPYKILIERLRQAIDPNNWSNSLWDVKAYQAERWLELEEKVSPGIRGKGRKTSVMVTRAIELAASGYSKGQIAIVLGVTPSAISKWIKRYPTFCEACR